jgi:hypothetical protein
MYLSSLKERIERSDYDVDAEAVAVALLRRPGARHSILPPSLISRPGARSQQVAAGPRPS